MKQTIEDLKKRRSIKKYRPEQITKEELDTILEAGTYAPTGKNAQSPLMVVVQKPELVQTLSQMNARVLGTKSDPFYGAPTVIVVFGDTHCNTWKEDASLVLGNLMNAAHAIEVGSCWIHRAQEMFETEEGKALMEQWGVPKHYAGVGNCILGYREGDMPVTRPRKEGYILFAQ